MSKLAKTGFGIKALQSVTKHLYVWHDPSQIFVWTDQSISKGTQLFLPKSHRRNTHIQQKWFLRQFNCRPWNWQELESDFEGPDTLLNSPLPVCRNSCTIVGIWMLYLHCVCFLYFLWLHRFSTATLSSVFVSCRELKFFEVFSLQWWWWGRWWCKFL